MVIDVNTIIFFTVGQYLQHKMYTVVNYFPQAFKMDLF